MSDSLFIPGVGSLDVIHTDEPAQVVAYLRGSIGNFGVVHIAIPVGDGKRISVRANQNQHQLPNVRATKALRSLTGMNMDFTGDVVLTGMDSETLSNLILELAPVSPY